MNVNVTHSNTYFGAISQFHRTNSTITGATAHQCIFILLFSLKTIILFGICAMWINLWSLDKNRRMVDDSDEVISLDSFEDDFEPTSTRKSCQCQFRENVCTGWKTT